jgi:hypothetical protein
MFASFVNGSMAILEVRSSDLTSYYFKEFLMKHILLPIIAAAGIAGLALFAWPVPTRAASMLSTATQSNWQVLKIASPTSALPARTFGGFGTISASTTTRPKMFDTFFNRRSAINLDENHHRDHDHEHGDHHDHEHEHGDHCDHGDNH